MEDYEYYHTEENPTDEPRELEYIHMATAIEDIFKPTGKINIPGAIFPLEAFILGDTVFTKCKSTANLEATLLRR